VSCGGLNTTLDALWNGVPIVAIPVAEDQPGVAARIAHAGVGLVEPARTITVARLRAAIVSALTDSRYVDAARRVQRQLIQIDGTARAIDLIETRMES
jgi:zeaxanthin glucosyltransferase